MTTESEYLAKKNPRTLAETKKLLALRLSADGTKPDAQLEIVHEQAGMFRRVLARGLTGADIAALIAPGAEAEPGPVCECPPAISGAHR